MARAALDLSQTDLGLAVSLDKKTLSNAEGGQTNLSNESMKKLEDYFLSRGLEFTDNDGVRKSPTGLRTYKGKNGFREFYDDLYETAKTEGGHICLINGVSKYVIEALGVEGVQIQKERMNKIKKNFTYQVLVEEGDNTFFGADYCEYRWLPKEDFHNETVFVYGTKIAFATFQDETTVTVFDRKEIADTFRLLFSLAWNQIAVKP